MENVARKITIVSTVNGRPSQMSYTSNATTWGQFKRDVGIEYSPAVYRIVESSTSLELTTDDSTIPTPTNGSSEVVLYVAAKKKIMSGASRLEVLRTISGLLREHPEYSSIFNQGGVNYTNCSTDILVSRLNSIQASQVDAPADRSCNRDATLEVINDKLNWLVAAVQEIAYNLEVDLDIPNVDTASNNNSLSEAQIAADIARLGL